MNQSNMTAGSMNLLLADDDLDDCDFFREALAEIPVSASLTTVNDGVRLMEMLSGDSTSLPHVLYLDLNMPLKNGFDCLLEIRNNPKLAGLPVIIFSTSYDAETANNLHDNGAHFYMRKPAEFLSLKNIIFKSINLVSESGGRQASKEKFLITS